MKVKWIIPWMLLVCAPYSSARITMQLGYAEVGSYPYQMGNGRALASPPGIALDIIHKAGKKLDIQLTFTRYPGKRLLKLLDSNQLDGIFIFSFNSERQIIGHYPMQGSRPDPAQRIATLSYFLYRLKGNSVNWDGQQITSLNELPVGAIAGYSIVQDLKQRGIRVDEAKSNPHNFNKLLLNRLGAVAAQDIVANAYLKANGVNSIEKITPPLTTKDYYLMLSHAFVKQYPEISKALWQQIGILRDPISRKNIHLYTMNHP